jgi:cytochrome P450
MVAGLPDLQRALRGNPGMIGPYVDEVLRLAGGIRRLGRRIVDNPMTVADVAIPRGAPIILDIERAGRDPAAYENPEMIDLNRRGPATLAFGGGLHPCMGPKIARTEICCAIQALLGRFSLSQAKEPELEPNRDMRQFATLPIHLEPLDLEMSGRR